MTLTARLRRHAALLAALLSAAVLTPLPAAAQTDPPYRLDPPAPGEGPYLDDPSDPPLEGLRTFAAQPQARYAASGRRFAPQSINELSGSNRFATSVAVSRAGWPNGAAAAIVATGEHHADALASSALAGTVDAPLLLTPTTRLEGAVAEELGRLKPQVVYVVGQVTGAVDEAVRGLGFEVERIAGHDVYSTAVALAHKAVELGADSSTVLVASGSSFPDALSASALAAGRKLPILLAPSTGSAWLRDRVRELGAERVWVVGGTAAVPDEVVAELPKVVRLAGSERTMTAVAVADRARANGLTGQPVLASAESFPDGLSGGVFAGLKRNAPVLLTYRAALSEAPARYLAAHGTGRVDLTGGSAAIAPLARCQIKAGDTRALVCVEEELRAQGYNVGPVDGRLDHLSVWSFYAFQKVAGLKPTGVFGEAEFRRLTENPRLTPRRPHLGPNHVEIDIARQLVLVVRDGEVRHVLHTSTGKRSTPTVRGEFTVYETRNYRQRHNAMYRPSFFYRGYAFHGYPEVPLYPASHGCARLYDGDMDFLWRFVQRGTRVASY